MSVVVNFFDMRREARRTLFSLTEGYQRGLKGGNHEVIVVDNGSRDPLDEAEVRAFGPGFRYLYYEATAPSPAAALNYGVEIAASDMVMLIIDGARILSPGILSYTLKAREAFERPFVYTLSLHLGPQLQNESLLRGYGQNVEDELLKTVDWRHDGYDLFPISSLADSSRGGFFAELAESNCVALRREDYRRLGGFDERFTSEGGGLANLDFFNRALEEDRLEPVMLLGEATFHQYHGGVATNVPWPEHPFQRFADEYERIRGRPYEKVRRRPHYLGHRPPQAAALFGAEAPPEG
jgi:glycosyltransferase involved in cell wall biosynthesis